MIVSEEERKKQKRTEIDGVQEIFGDVTNTKGMRSRSIRARIPLSNRDGDFPSNFSVTELKSKRLSDTGRATYLKIDGTRCTTVTSTAQQYTNWSTGYKTNHSESQSAVRLISRPSIPRSTTQRLSPYLFFPRLPSATSHYRVVEKTNSIQTML